MYSRSAYLSLALLLSACSREEERVAPYYENQWIEIDKMILEDAFSPNESRTISFESAGPKEVRLITDMGYELSMKERSDGKSGLLLSSEDHPNEFVGTTYGASTLFTPENGKIRLKVSNQSDIPLRIAVCVIHAKGANQPPQPTPQKRRG
jgi:hypothetical protein